MYVCVYISRNFYYSLILLTYCCYKQVSEMNSTNDPTDQPTIQPTNQNPKIKAGKKIQIQNTKRSI